VVTKCDVVMAVTDMTQERRLVGHVALVPELGDEAVISMDLIKIIAKEGISNFYLKKHEPCIGNFL